MRRLGLLALLLIGCGGSQRPWQDSAHIALNGAAHALSVADSLVADAIHHDPDPSTVRERFHNWVMGYTDARASLILAQSAVDSAVAVQTADAKCRAVVAIERAVHDIEPLSLLLVTMGVRTDPGIAAALHDMGSLAALLASPGCSP